MGVRPRHKRFKSVIFDVLSGPIDLSQFTNPGSMIKADCDASHSIIE